MKVIICDRCRKELGNESYSIHMRKKTSGAFSESDIDGMETLAEMDFCKECAEKIIKFVKSEKEKPEIKTEQKPKVEEKEDSKSQKGKFDIGKCMALRNAGWTNIQIADEMGKTAQYIANIVCIYKKSMELQG